MEFLLIIAVFLFVIRLFRGFFLILALIMLLGFCNRPAFADPLYMHQTSAEYRNGKDR